MSALVIGSVVAAPLALPAMVLAALVDLVTRERRWRRLRTVMFVLGLLYVDLAGFVVTTGAWLLQPVGLRMQSPTVQWRYHRIMTWWTQRLMRVISTTVPLPIDTSQLDEDALGGNAIVIGRHRSLLDAVLPSTIFGPRGLIARYTLKEDLRWEPNIDVVGHRMGHRFVRRAPKNLDAELEPIRALASRVDDDSVAVIFPEGTFFTEARKAKVIAALERKDPEHADAARQMNHLLPPRPAGTLALMEGAPGADIIILGHVGFEPFGTIGKIFAGIGADHPVRVAAWRHPRSSVPEDQAGRIDWLFDRWLELDEWISKQHAIGDQPATERAHNDKSGNIARV